MNIDFRAAFIIRFKIKYKMAGDFAPAISLAERNLKIT